MRQVVIYKVVEFVPFLLLWRDAKRFQVNGVSAQTCAALTVSVAISSWNMPANRTDAVINLVMTAMTSCIGLCCTRAVAKASDVVSEADLIPRSVPRWVQWIVVYMAAVVLALVASFVACHASVAELANWIWTFPVGILCTFQNFLHGTALLPQLLISRQRGYVAPAAARFLFIIAIKHIIEFFADLGDTYILWQAGRLNLHEASYMSADFFAAVMLLDFMYLYAVSNKLFTMPRFGGCCRRSATGESKRSPDLFAVGSLPLPSV